MVVVTAWVRTIQPAKERRFAFHLARQFCICSIMYPKSWFISKCLIRKPKYLPREGVDQNPNISNKPALVSTATLGEKNTLNFSWLTFCLKRLQKVSSASLTAMQFLWSAFTNKTKSPTKKRWEKTKPPWDALTRFHKLALHFYDMRAPNTSIQRINR